MSLVDEGGVDGHATKMIQSQAEEDRASLHTALS